MKKARVFTVISIVGIVALTAFLQVNMTPQPPPAGLIDNMKLNEKTQMESERLASDILMNQEIITIDNQTDLINATTDEETKSTYTIIATDKPTLGE